MHAHRAVYRVSLIYVLRERFPIQDDDIFSIQNRFNFRSVTGGSRLISVAERTHIHSPRVYRHHVAAK